MVPVEGGPQYAVVPVVKDGVVSMLVTDPNTGVVSLATNEGLTPVPEGDVQRNGEKVTGVTGYQSLNLGTLSGNADYKAQWDALQPPDRQGQGHLPAGHFGDEGRRRHNPGYKYDAAQDAMVSTTTGEVFPADEQGRATSSRPRAKSSIRVGGSASASRTTPRCSPTRPSGNASCPILIWTFVFSILTTILNFGLGLILALVLNESRMRGQKIYRLLFIVPYGLPFILTALIWKAMLNTDFGLINQILGTNVPWLENTTLARFSILAVNLWAGFSYFFLVCSGALTSIPVDLKEAAFVDGASGRYAFRTVVLPMLLVATAPLLVTTFAFNFNNFNLIYLLTGGGPFPGSVNDGGSTDLLITYTYRIGFNGADQKLGLASAIAMLIFVIVGSVSAYGFRLTRKLEEIGQ